MTYQLIDESVESAQPILLYEIVVGATTYRLTDQATSVTATVSGVSRTWASAVLLPGTFSQSDDIGKDTLELRVDKSSALAAEFIDGAPESVIVVTVYRTFVGESEVLLYWKGRISDTDADEASLLLNCVPDFSDLKQMGLRDMYMSTCRRLLYSPSCGLSKTDYDTTQTAWEVQGDKVRIGAFSARSGYWVGGLFAMAGGIERTILEHLVGSSGDWLRLSRPIKALAVALASNPPAGVAVTLYRGCDHTYAACKERSNKGRFGGEPWFRRRNPFTTSIVS